MAQYPAPVYANWGEALGSGINRGFENIMQGMQLAQQRKMAELAFQGQTGYSPSQLLGGQEIAGRVTPGSPAVAPTYSQVPQQPGPSFNMQQAYQGMPTSPAPYSGGQGPMRDPQEQQLAATSAMAPQGPPLRQDWQQQPQQLTPGSPAVPATIGGQPLSSQQNDMYQSFLNFTNQGKRTAEAKVSNVEAQARERSALAGKAERWTPSVGGAGSANNMTAEEWKVLTEYAYDHPGHIPSDILTSRGPKSKFIAEEIKLALARGEEYDAAGLNVRYGADRAGAAAGSRLTQGGSSQVVARTANSAKEQLGILREVSQQFPRSDIQAMNAPILSLAKQSYPNAQNWLTAVNSVRYEYATALARGNKPGEQDLSEASRALPDNITPTQLESAIPLIERLIDATVKGQMTPAAAPKDGKTPAPKASGAAPKVGEIKKGYRFKGGDPAKPGSWEKAS